MAQTSTISPGPILPVLRSPTSDLGLRNALDQGPHVSAPA